MTLDEALALLPDNTTGQISASDLRDIVTAMWGTDDALSARIGVLEAAGDLHTIVGVWQVNQTVGAAPSTGQVTKDQAAFSSVNWLRFTETDVEGTDLGTALLQASVIYMQMRTDRTKWVRYDVSGTPTDAGTYIQVPVTYDASNGGTFTNGANALAVIGVVPAP